MAENVNETEAAIQNINLNENELANVYYVPGQNILPGEVPEYSLPQDNMPEPFEAITFFAINESGPHGPLNAELLQHFLEQKIEGERQRNILHFVQEEYTLETLRFHGQLGRLLARIVQIEMNESQQTTLFKERIRALINGLSSNNQVPPIMVLPSSYVTEKAIDSVAPQGPLDRPGLIELIIGGSYMQIQNREDIKKQLTKISYAICNIISLNKIHYNEVKFRITHAILYLGKNHLQ